MNLRAAVGAGIMLIASCSGGDSAAPVGVPAATIGTTAAPIAATASPTSADATASAPTAPPTTRPYGPNTDCIIVVEPGDYFGALVERAEQPGLTVDALLAENSLSEASIIHPDDKLDICVGNDIDDITGSSRLAPDADTVMAQQRQLNTLFSKYIIADLKVDGDSGPLTRQLLCTARLGLGLPISMNHLDPDSPEAEVIMNATELQVPAGAASWSSKWILIDETCQTMIAGEGESTIVEVYPTSTGQSDFPTHNVPSATAYRFDPATDNGGWHDSSLFPSPPGTPNNGNMYKPLYFNGGQAIHGANYVPPEPRSKGCARTFPWHQDQLLRWVGLDDRRQPIWNSGAIGLIVTVQGQYRKIE